jgi:uncharacterized BrkB/YihY/UPF0761 family membrane protein
VADARDPFEPGPIEIDAEPTLAGRLARRLERARILRRRIEDSRGEHRSVDLALSLVERDSSIGGGLLAGALAYKLFVLLLPTVLLLVSGFGLYAGSIHKSPKAVVQEVGLHGLIASEVATSASGRHRALVFLLVLPAVLWATVSLYRAVAKVHAIAWLGSGRGVRITSKGVALFGAALAIQLVAFAVVAWARRDSPLGGLLALLAYVVVVGGVWAVVSNQLPHRRVRWWALVPGAVLFGVGLLFVNAFDIYVTTRLVEGQANTYGALGVATALLLSLVLVGRLMVVSAELNAAIDDQRGQKR